MGFNPRDVVSDLQEDLSGFSEPLGPDDSPQVAAGKHMFASFKKRAIFSLAADAEQKALEKFLSCNAGCEQYRPPGLSHEHAEIFELLKREIWRFWYTSHDNVSALVENFEDIFDVSDLGPGSNIMARGTDFYTKVFSSPLTYTRDCLFRAYQHVTEHRATWSLAELERSAHYGECKVEGNRLSFVPKSDEISRTIGTEPILNMLFQLGFGNRLRSRLRKIYNIDLSVQPDLNRAMALVGSLDQSFCTADLRSASDTIAIRLLQELLPRDFLSWLLLLRSPVTRLPDGSTVQLHMISSMGNGFTFPLQTLIFTASVVAVYRHLGIPVELGKGGRTRNLGVFGDDIICVKQAFDTLVSFLGTLGFQVNTTKSFSEGPFRESCGLDAWKGVDIRPVFFQSLDRPHERYAYVNRLIRWSSLHGIPLWKTVDRLLKSVRFLPIPPWDNEDAGIKVPSSHAPRTWSKRYQSRCYERWAVKPMYIRILDDKILVPRSEKSRILSYEGLTISFLRGELRDMRIAVRHNIAVYISKKGIAPNWSVPTADPWFRGLVEQSWSRTARAYLTK